MEGKRKKYTYDKLERRYQKLSHINFQKCHRIDTEEGYREAAKREKRLRKAFFSDCKRYLDGNLKSKL